MERTLGEWGRKGIGHWVNGVGEEKKQTTTQEKKTTTPDGVGEKKKGIKN